MKELLTFATLALSLTLWSCNDSAENEDASSPAEPDKVAKDVTEKLAEDTEAMMKKITAVVKEVNAGADPEKAAEKLEKYKADVQDLSARIKTIVEEEFDGNREAFNEKMEEFAEEGDLRDTMIEQTQELDKLMSAGEEKAVEFMKKISELMVEIR